MTKDEIITRAYQQNKTLKQDVADIVQATFDIIKETLERGEKVKIKNFGNFFIRSKKGRTWNNPETGPEVVIPGHKVVMFSSSPAMKKAVNNIASGEAETVNTSRKRSGTKS